MKQHGTVHIAFGNSAATTLASIKTLSAATDFYRLAKHDKNLRHYVYILPATAEGRIDYSRAINLTARFFRDE